MKITKMFINSSLVIKVLLDNGDTESLEIGDSFKYLVAAGTVTTYEIVHFDEETITYKTDEMGTIFNTCRIPLTKFINTINTKRCNIDYISIDKNNGKDLFNKFESVKSVHKEYVELLEKYSALGKDIKDGCGCVTIADINRALKYYKIIVSGELENVIIKAENYDSIKKLLQ